MGVYFVEVAGASQDVRLAFKLLYLLAAPKLDVIVIRRAIEHGFKSTTDEKVFVGRHSHPAICREYHELATFGLIDKSKTLIEIVDDEIRTYHTEELGTEMHGEHHRHYKQVFRTLAEYARLLDEDIFLRLNVIIRIDIKIVVVIADDVALHNAVGAFGEFWDEPAGAVVKLGVGVLGILAIENIGFPYHIERLHISLGGYGLLKQHRRLSTVDAKLELWIANLHKPLRQLPQRAYLRHYRLRERA